MRREDLIVTQRSDGIEALIVGKEKQDVGSAMRGGPRPGGTRERQLEQKDCSDNKLLSGGHETIPRTCFNDGPCRARQFFSNRQSSIVNWDA
jgi:hypothetical protein